MLADHDYSVGGRCIIDGPYHGHRIAAGLGWGRAPGCTGLSYGINAHAIGTAHALQEGEECGAFAALAKSLWGILTALALPLVFTL